MYIFFIDFFTQLTHTAQRCRRDREIDRRWRYIDMFTCDCYKQIAFYVRVFRFPSSVYVFMCNSIWCSHMDYLKLLFSVRAKRRLKSWRERVCVCVWKRDIFQQNMKMIHDFTPFARDVHTPNASMHVIRSSHVLILSREQMRKKNSQRTRKKSNKFDKLK